MQSIICEHLDYVHACTCDYRIEMSSVVACGNPCQAWVPVNATWYGDTITLPSFPEAPVYRSEVTLSGVIPTVTWPDQNIVATKHAMLD